MKVILSTVKPRSLEEVALRPLFGTSTPVIQNLIAAVHKAESEGVTIDVNVKRITVACEQLLASNKDGNRSTSKVSIKTVNMLRDYIEWLEDSPIKTPDNTMTSALLTAIDDVAPDPVFKKRLNQVSKILSIHKENLNFEHKANASVIAVSRGKVKFSVTIKDPLKAAGGKNVALVFVTRARNYAKSDTWGASMKVLKTLVEDPDSKYKV